MASLWPSLSWSVFHPAIGHSFAEWHPLHPNRGNEMTNKTNIHITCQSITVWPHADAYPFINEGNKSISFRFSCSQILHHTSVTECTKHKWYIKTQLERFWNTCGPNCATYDIFPNGAKAALTSSVEISGLRSPTNTWKWSTKIMWGVKNLEISNHTT